MKVCDQLRLNLQQNKDKNNRFYYILIGLGIQTYYE